MRPTSISYSGFKPPIERINDLVDENPSYVIHDTKTIPIIISTRNGSRSIVRRNFEQPQSKSRQLPDFDNFESLDRAKNGMLVQLGESTLDKMFKVMVADPTDKEWLAERDRLVASGWKDDQLQANPPLGREQRKIDKTVNIGDASLSAGTQLDAISRLIESSHADGKDERFSITEKVVDILTALKGSTNLNFTQTGQILSTLGTVPSDYKKLRLHDSNRQQIRTQRFINKQIFTDNQGTILAFLLSNTPQGLSASLNKVAFTATGMNSSAVGVLSLIQYMGNGHVLDLQDRIVARAFPQSMPPPSPTGMSTLSMLNISPRANRAPPAAPVAAPSTPTSTTTTTTNVPPSQKKSNKNKRKTRSP